MIEEVTVTKKEAKSFDSDSVDLERAEESPAKSEEHSHEHGSNCSCNSSYEEEEITYKITERVTKGGEVITEKVEVVGGGTELIDKQEDVLPGFDRGFSAEKDIIDFLQVDIPNLADGAGIRRNRETDYF